MSDRDREEYERRLRSRHSEPLWWENLGEHKRLVSWPALAVVVMVVVGLALT